MPADLPERPGSPITLPAMTDEQLAAWHTLLDLDARLPDTWCVIGGQMVLAHCAAAGREPHRPTDDGDIVVHVTTPGRRSLTAVTSALLTLDYHEERDSNDYGYRYTRGDTHIDVLAPEGSGRLALAPTTARGARTIEAPGANQALARAQRAAVVLPDGHTGHVPLPTLLGALIAKAAARVADRRDPERHALDFVVLASIAYDQVAFRAMRDGLTRADRRRLRDVLRLMPDTARAWQAIPSGLAVRTAVQRLEDGT